MNLNLKGIKLVPAGFDNSEWQKGVKEGAKKLEAQKAKKAKKSDQ